ncbi:transcription factor-like 5 [Pelobates cultripes]|uniref:Transcription factor-like 5 n=1 Tax=Pelobates cultripes TaxID=61616 RepID=A0AAD1WD51_PELCU|nr:transcription factor-like 5 [Pelobates cultripes]
MASTTHTLSSDPTSSTGPRGSREVMGNEQAMNFTATDLNIVEMTEVEYTQLQQILYSHMDAQASEGEMEAKLNSSFYTASNSSSLSQYLSSSVKNQTSFTTSSSGGPSVHHGIYQSALVSESSMLTSNHSLGPSDFKDFKSLMLNESHLTLNQAEKTPSENNKDPKRLSLARVQHCDNTGGTNKENENLLQNCEARSKSTVRVRLEDRFNSMKAEMPRSQELQESGVPMNNLVNLIRHPSQLIGVQQQSKCSTLVKNKASPGTSALPFAYPVFTSGSNSSGNGNSSQSQYPNTRNYRCQGHFPFAISRKLNRLIRL